MIEGKGMYISQKTLDRIRLKWMKEGKHCCYQKGHTCIVLVSVPECNGCITEEIKDEIAGMTGDECIR